MYFLDPVWDRRRHALLRDQLVRFSHQVERGVGSLSRDLRNRTRGVVGETQALLHP